MCCHLVSENEASATRICSNARQFLIHSTFVLLVNLTAWRGSCQHVGCVSQNCKNSNKLGGMVKCQPQAKCNSHCVGWQFLLRLPSTHLLREAVYLRHGCELSLTSLTRVPEVILTAWMLSCHSNSDKWYNTVLHIFTCNQVWKLS